MDFPYPPAPAQVPPGLTRPSASYQRHAWAATAGLIAFLALYFGLVAWLGRLAWSLVEAFQDGSQVAFSRVLLAFPAIFLVVVLVRGLFRVRRNHPPDLLEVQADEHPELVAFLHQVARDAGAPLPRKIYLSPRVNAAVFYDLGLWNLIVPTHKNLEVGLGLVNQLSLDEFKAVIAHEFGHFSQRTMRVGIWVYLTRQFVGDLLSRRDGFDRFLDGLSRVDIRIAWIGWGMRLLIWSIRSIMDTAFRGVILLERALSRQMEFQADLVSVSLTGSQSLVHALHRISAADETFGIAVNFAVSEARDGHGVADLYTLVDHVVARRREILDRPDYGLIPQRAEGAPVFRVGLAEVPRMWSSHPPNAEREANARRTPLPSPLDSRSAWVLFREPERLRAEVTRRVLREALEKDPPKPAPLAETLVRLAVQNNRLYFARRYRGAYLGRPLTRHTLHVAELVGPPPAPDQVLAALDAIYTDALAADLELLRERTEEKEAVSGLQEGFLQAPGGVIRFRGRELRRRDLKPLVAQVAEEHAAAQAAVHARDRAARAAHLGAALAVGRGWPEHLRGLVALLHYAEHSLAEVEDAHGHLVHVFQVVTADGKVSSAELEYLITACNHLVAAMRAQLQHREAVVLPEPVRQRLKVPDWSHALPSGRLPGPPSGQDLAEGWLGAAETWARAWSGALQGLRVTTLDSLIEAEALLERHAREGYDPGNAPAPARVPARYTMVLSGTERPRQKKLDAWDRFLIADGPVATAGRLAVAAGVLGPALFLSAHTGEATVAVYNGLGVPVEVTLDELTREVPAHGAVRLSHHPGRVHVVTRTLDGEEIEAFDEQIPGSQNAIIYNVAQASALVEWTAVYGAWAERPPRWLGAPRWKVSSADLLFEPAPKSISSKGDGGSRDVLDAVPFDAVQSHLAHTPDPEERGRLLAAHVRWDPLDQAEILSWLYLASLLPDGAALVSGRAQAHPDDVVLRRAEMDLASPVARSELCAQHTARAQAAPQDAAAAYLAARCLPEGTAQDDAFIAAAARSPDYPWLRDAAGHTLAQRGQWAEALTLLDQAVKRADSHPALRPRIAEDALRVRRLLAPRPTDAAVDDLGAFPELVTRAGVESWTTPPNTALPEHLAAWLLQSGEVEGAATSSGVSEAWAPTLAVLVGASEGADTGQVQAALAVKPTDLGPGPAAIVALALATREGQDRGPWLGVLAPLELPSALLDALSLDLRKDPARLDAAVLGLGPEERGAARAAGVVLLGDAAPAAWRQEARALLLVDERPYLRRP